MKRKIILFLTLITTAFFLFVLTSSADNIYADYTKPGVNGESPLFSFLGYTTSEDGSIAVGYKIDHNAIENYKSATGNDIKIGVVVTLKDFIDGTKPLDESGAPTGENKDKILVVNFNECYDRAFATIYGVSEKMLDSHLIMSLFVVDNEGVKYVGDETTDVGPQSISMNDATQGLPATPAVPPITEVEINGMTYSINGVTEQSWDRLKQQNASNADYNKGSSLGTLKLYAALAIANGIAVGGDSLVDMPVAADFMSHYLEKTGSEYKIDVAQFISDDSGALAARNKAINNALRASEQLAQKNKSLTIGQLTEGHPMQWELATDNWRYAIGSYFDDVDVINLTVTEVNGVKTYSADIKYIVTDFYNWDTNDYNKFKDLISPHDLHELHKAGKAKEFMSYGEIVYSITWTEGQTVDQIEGLK